MIFQFVTQAAQQLISINVLHMINGDYQLYSTGFTPSNTYELPYQSHTYQTVRPCVVNNEHSIKENLITQLSLVLF